MNNIGFLTEPDWNNYLASIAEVSYIESSGKKNKVLYNVYIKI